MQTNLYAEYAALKADKIVLETSMDAIKEQIIADLNTRKVEKEVTVYGTFTRSNRTTYKYSDKVTALAEKLKIAKIKEEEKGIAKPSVTEYLVFTSPKE